MEIWLPFDKDSIKKKQAEFIENIKHNPIPDFLLEDKLDNKVENNVFKKYSVKETTVEDVFYMCMYIANKVFPEEKYEIPFDILVKEIKDIYEYNPAEPFGYRCNVKVNLNFSDKEIIEDFTKWLIRYRKTTGFRAIQKKDSTKLLKEFGEKELKQWVENKILPYIDLTLIANYESKRLRQKNLFNLIFPDDINCLNPDEKIKKTVKPIADWLLSESTLKAMELQLDNS